MKVLILLTTRSIPSGVSKSLIDRPCIITLYQGSPFYRLIIKGSTPLIIACFSIKKSALNSGVILTIILPFILREIVDIIRFIIPLVLKALLIKLRITKGENSLA